MKLIVINGTAIHSHVPGAAWMIALHKGFCAATLPHEKRNQRRIIKLVCYVQIEKYIGRPLVFSAGDLCPW